MAVVYADVTREASTTTGTGSMTLDGVIIPGYQRFQDALINGDEVDYEINDIAGGGVDREVGRGTWTAAGNTLSRDVVEFSTNADALVSWPAGIKQVRLTVKAAFFNTPGGLAIGDTITGATDTFVLHVGALGILAQSAGMRYGEANLGLHLTSQAIDEVPFEIVGANGQTADLWQSNPDGVTAGDRAKVNAAGDFSHNKGLSGSQSFGVGTTLTAADATAIGDGSYASGSSVAVGKAAFGFGGSNVAIGEGADANAANNVCVGRDTLSNHAGAICIGRSAHSTATNQLVIGDINAPINDVFFGTGVVNLTPGACTIHGSGALGTDVAGANLLVAGGQGTGTGGSGVVKIQVAPVGLTGTTPNALTDAVEVDADTTAGNTRMLLYDVDNATLERVTVGAADSGGAGFKLLRIPN